jgi:hypothetical protein
LVERITVIEKNLDTSGLFLVAIGGGGGEIQKTKYFNFSNARNLNPYLINFKQEC